jgi:thiamine biosynthesis lipoprotein
METLEFRAMNTSVLLAAEGDHGFGTGLQEARAFIEECERRFSRFLPDSEVSWLNSAGGQWIKVSKELLELLMLSRAYYDETGGLFDPSVLPDLKRAGYDVSLDDVRARGNSQAAKQARAPRPAFSTIELDIPRCRVRMPRGMEVDLGGIAKGWIVQEAAMRLKAHAQAGAVNAGGDLFFAGMPADGSKWRVEIEDPRDESDTAAVLQVGEGAVVTSSISKRTWKQNGELRHHLIDPQTGEPARTDWLSVTVIAPRADLAEAYAKALLIGGHREAARLMRHRPQIAAVCVGFDGKITASQNSKDYLNDCHDLVQQK